MKHQIIVKTVFIIVLGIILWIMAGCTLTKSQRQSNKVARKIEKLQVKYPEAWKDVTIEVVRIDTLIERVEIAGELRIDTVEITEILKEYITDTVLIPKIIVRFLQSTRDTTSIDTLGIHLWVAGTNVDFKVVRDSIYIEKEQEVKTVTITNTEVVRRNFFNDWKFYLLVAIIIGGLLLHKNIRPRIFR